MVRCAAGSAALWRKQSQCGLACGRGRTSATSSLPWVSTLRSRGGICRGRTGTGSCSPTSSRRCRSPHHSLEEVRRKRKEPHAYLGTFTIARRYVLETFAKSKCPLMKRRVAVPGEHRLTELPMQAAQARGADRQRGGGGRIVPTGPRRKWRGRPRAGRLRTWPPTVVERSAVRTWLTGNAGEVYARTGARGGREDRPDRQAGPPEDCRAGEAVPVRPKCRKRSPRPVFTPGSVVLPEVLARPGRRHAVTPTANRHCRDHPVGRARRRV